MLFCSKSTSSLGSATPPAKTLVSPLRAAPQAHARLELTPPCPFKSRAGTFEEDLSENCSDMIRAYHARKALEAKTNGSKKRKSAGTTHSTSKRPKSSSSANPRKDKVDHDIESAAVSSEEDDDDQAGEDDDDAHNERVRELINAYLASSNDWEVRLLPLCFSTFFPCSPSRDNGQEMIQDVITIERNESGLLRLFVTWSVFTSLP